MDQMSCNLRGQGREGEAAGTSLAPNLRELLYSRMVETQPLLLRKEARAQASEKEPQRG